MPYKTVIIDIPAILQRAGVKPGMVVADFGTGREGRMALGAGKIIGDSGKAYAIDVVKTILPTIANKATMHGINNVETVWSDLEVYGATKVIADNSVDVGFLVTTLFQSRERLSMMKESLRMIQPGGKLVVVDWRPDVSATLGPEMDRRVHVEEIVKYAQELNIELVEEFEPGEYHWGLIFVK